MIIAIQHVRTLAIVMTLIAHIQYGMITPSKSFAYFNANIGQFWGGVELFFVVSGYLITGILMKSLVNEASAGANLSKSKLIGSFYIKRATRILPSAIFWALFILAFSFAYPESKFGNPEQNIKHFTASIFFFENIYLTYDMDFRYSVYWSLSLEEQFYLFLPILIILLRKHIFTFLVIAYLCQALINKPVSQANLLFMIRYDALMLGSIIFFIIDKGWLLTIKQYAISKLSLCTLLLFFLIGLITAPVFSKEFYPVTITDLFAGLFVITTIIFAEKLNFSSNRLSKASLWIADRSFTLYLAHKPCMFLAHWFSNTTKINILPSSLLDFNWLIIVTLVFMASHLCYKYIEQPIRSMGRRIVLNRNYE